MPGNALAPYPEVAPAEREYCPKIAVNIPKTDKATRISSDRNHHARTEPENDGFRAKFIHSCNIRVKVFEDTYTMWREKCLSQSQAEEVLGDCERTFRCRVGRCREDESERVEALRDHRILYALLASDAEFNALLPPRKAEQEISISD